MRRLTLLISLLATCGAAVPAQTLYLSPDVATAPDGSDLLPSEVIRCDTAAYSVVQTVAGSPTLSALHKMDQPDHWLFAVEAPNLLAGQITVPIPGADAEPRDVILDDGSGTYAKFLCGGSLGDPLPAGVVVDALYLAGGDGGDLVLSFDLPIERPSGSGTFYGPADLLRFARTDPDDCGDWSFSGPELDASTVGVPAGADLIGAARVGSAFLLAFDVAVDLSASCSATTACVPGQIVELDGATFGLFRDLQTVGSPGWSMESLVHALSCEANPGRVYDATSLPVGLLLGKASAGDVVLSWPDGSCSSGGTDYGIYEGSLSGLFGGAYDHVRIDCADDGADLQETITPSSGNRYYLVVPHNDKLEGSYSTDSAGSPRPQPALETDRCRVDRVITPCP